MKVNEIATILSNDNIATDIYSMIIKTAAAKWAVPGQFVSLYTNDESKKLPRPISICEIDKEASTLRLVYRVAGEGTKQFSSLSAGDKLHLLGPLGNGFTIEDKYKAPMVVGGGIGIPPMLELSKQLTGEVVAVLGYRSDETFLVDQFIDNADTYIASDDGSIGTHGTVVDAIKENELKPDVIYACGPKPMLRGLAALAKEMRIDCYVSMEERMACGIGACLGCVCQSTEVDDHSLVKNKRICKDGPVFKSTEVEL